MIVTAGINCGLVSVVFYIGSVFLTDGKHWAAVRWLFSAFRRSVYC